jgi:hypothetical protein
MQAYIDDIMPTCSFNAQVDLTHSWVWLRGPSVSNKELETMKSWLARLEANDPNLELQDALGDTALLAFVQSKGAKSLEVVHLLLKLGADVHAINRWGFNAMQYAMRSPFGELPEIVEEKFSLLIEAGADLHYRNSLGATPSHGARCHYGRWKEWCRALDRNGKKIEDVVRKDGELWLLDENFGWNYFHGKDCRERPIFYKTEGDEEEGDEEEGDEEEGDEEEGDEEEGDEEEGDEEEGDEEG